MRYKTVTFSHTYPVFEIGERIRPSSRRAGLPDGVYVVTAYHPPLDSTYGGIVFVDGHQYGLEASYWTTADGDAPPLPLTTE